MKKKKILVKKEYIRDQRSPMPRSESVSRVMSANKGEDTGPELVLRKALRKEGLIGYRLHPKKVPGKPDIAFLKERIAVFVHGCFWHHCKKHSPKIPKTNKTFWKEKFWKNKERDERKLKILRSTGWKSIVIWEHEIKKDPTAAARRIAKRLYPSK